MAKNIEINVNTDTNIYEILYPKVNLSNSINNLDWDRVNKRWVVFKATRAGTDTVITSYTLNYPSMLPVFFVYTEADRLGDSDLFTYCTNISFNNNKKTSTWNFTMQNMIVFNHYLTQTGVEHSQEYMAYYNAPYGSGIYPHLKVTFSWTTTSLTISINAALGNWDNLEGSLDGADIGNGYRSTYNFLVGGFSLI